MPALTWDLQVEPAEDGERYVVRADQRDFAAWEVEPFGWPITMIRERAGVLVWRWLAWHACRRTGLTKQPWPEWSDSVIEVHPLAEQDVEVDAEDPGRPGRSVTPS